MAETDAATSVVLPEEQSNEIENGQQVQETITTKIEETPLVAAAEEAAENTFTPEATEEAPAAATPVTASDDGMIDDVDGDSSNGIEPGELPSANEGNSDVGDMDVLEAILGDGDETKDEFDKEIDANTTAKKPATPAKAKKTTKSTGKWKPGKKKTAKKSDPAEEKVVSKPEVASGSTQQTSEKSGQEKMVTTANNLDKMETDPETATALAAKKSDTKTTKKSKEKTVSSTSDNQGKQSAQITESPATPKSAAKASKKKKSAMKSTKKKEPKKVEKAQTNSVQAEPTVNSKLETADNNMNKKTKEVQKQLKSPTPKVEVAATKVATKPSTKGKKERFEKTSSKSPAVDRKRKASDTSAGKEMKPKKGKDVKVKTEKVENSVADEAPVENKDSEKIMKVIDDVDDEAALSDHGCNFSHHSEFSKSPSFTESLSGSFSVTLSEFSDSRSSLDSFERELHETKKKRKKRKHTEGDGNQRERHKEFLDVMLKGARYFIIKSNNHENVTLSKAKGVWATPPANERKLNDAYKQTTNVILVFSVKESGRFQGFARLASGSRHDGIPVPWVLPPGFDRRILGGTFKVDWLNRKEVTFSKCANLRNPWNENKEVKICRDGQELEPSVGEVLCRMFEDDMTIDLSRVEKHLEQKRHNRSSGGGDFHQRRERFRGGFRGGDWRGRGGFRGGGGGGGGFRGGERGRFGGRRRGGFSRGSPAGRGRFHDDNRRREKYDRRAVENESFHHHRNRSRSPEYRRNDRERESRDRRHKDRVKEFLKEDRSKYGIREETLLHGSYSDYVREFQRQKELDSRGSSYYPSSSANYMGSSSSSRHHSYQVNVASAEEFLRRTRR